MNLFKISLFLTFIFLSHLPVSALTIDEDGFIGGGVVSKFKGNTITNDQNDMKVSFFGSYFINHFINDSLSVQVELSIKQQGSNLTYEMRSFNGMLTVEESITLTYVEIPLLLKLPYLSSDRTKLQIYGGPFIGYLLKSNRSGSFVSSGATLITDDNFSGQIPNTEKIQYGFTFGNDFRLQSGKHNFFIVIRYSFYLSKIFKELSPLYISENGDHPIINTAGLDFLSLKHNHVSVGIGLYLNLF